MPRSSALRAHCCCRHSITRECPTTGSWPMSRRSSRHRRPVVPDLPLPFSRPVRIALASRPGQAPPSHLRLPHRGPQGFLRRHGLCTRGGRDLAPLQGVPVDRSCADGRAQRTFAGCISATANLNSDLCARAWRNGDAEALDAAVTIRKLLDGKQLVAGVKALLAHIHRDPAWARVQPPLSPFSAADRTSVRQDTTGYAQNGTPAAGSPSPRSTVDDCRKSVDHRLTLGRRRL